LDVGDRQQIGVIGEGDLARADPLGVAEVEEQAVGQVFAAPLGGSLHRLGRPPGEVGEADDERMGLLDREGIDEVSAGRAVAGRKRTVVVAVEQLSQGFVDDRVGGAPQGDGVRVGFERPAGGEERQGVAVDDQRAGDLAHRVAFERDVGFAERPVLRVIEVEHAGFHRVAELDDESAGRWG